MPRKLSEHFTLEEMIFSQTAAREGKRVIACAHHPIFPAGPHNVWNADRLLEIVLRNSNVVAKYNSRPPPRAARPKGLRYHTGHATKGLWASRIRGHRERYRRRGGLCVDTATIFVSGPMNFSRSAG